MKIGVAGCTGRIGSLVLKHVLGYPDLALGACATSPDSADIGRDAGALHGGTPVGVTVSGDPESLFATCDLVIDFSAPDATAEYATLAAARNVRLVTGTTGLSRVQQNCIHLASQKIAILQAPNMSLGANVLLALTEQLSAVLDAEYDVEVIGKLHRRKVDAPSGTSLALARAAAKGRAVDFDSHLEQQRVGHIGPRPRGAIGVATMRGGDNLSEHVVMFAGTHERLEISHSVLSEEILVLGAIRAAIWLQSKPPGLYDLRDMLVLRGASR
jgi:4-hydroxy-tetrahydrodipicolinate reductase